MPEDSASLLLSALKRFFDELDESDTEFDLRYPLCRHVLEEALGWRKWTKARALEGGFTIEKDRKDVRCLDDSNPPFPVVIIETKAPSQELDLSHTEQLRTYVQAVGSVKVSALTNGRRFVMYSGTSMRKTADLDVEALVGKQVQELSAEERTAILELEGFRQDRFVQRGDADFLRQTEREVELKYVPGRLAHESYLQFVGSLKASLDDFQTCFRKFFETYQDRESSDYSHAFLKVCHERWLEWREFSPGRGDPTEVFCRETGYILLNRILFARLAEDKWLLGNRQLSGPGLASRIGPGRRTPYLDVLE